MGKGALWPRLLGKAVLKTPLQDAFEVDSLEHSQTTDIKRFCVYEFVRQTSGRDAPLDKQRTRSFGRICSAHSALSKAWASSIRRICSTPLKSHDNCSRSRDGKRHGPPMFQTSRRVRGLAERNEHRQPPARASAATFSSKLVGISHPFSGLCLDRGRGLLTTVLVDCFRQCLKKDYQPARPRAGADQRNGSRSSDDIES